MPGLSKSKYTKFCQCDKALWLKTYKHDLEVIDDATQARFEAGNVVGDLAMGLFGDYKEAHAEKPDGRLDLETMTAQTKQWMDDGVENICEASFIYDGNYCAVDILRKTEDGWAIYEVKSSTYPEFNGRPSEIERYAPDIAYQKWLLTQCGVNVTGTFLVCLNSDYVRHGDLDLQNLFVTIDMQGMVANELLKVPNNVVLAKKTMERADEPDTDIDNHCHSPYDCTFWDYCSRHLPKLSVFDVYGGKGKQFPFSKKVELYKAGKVAFEDLRGESIGVVQDLQIACMLDQRDYIDREFISQFLSELYYPLYFLDFESVQEGTTETFLTNDIEGKYFPFHIVAQIVDNDGNAVESFYAINEQQLISQIREKYHLADSLNSLEALENYFDDSKDYDYLYIGGIFKSIGDAIEREERELKYIQSIKTSPK